MFNGEAADVITLTAELGVNDADGVAIDASGIAAGVTIDGGAGTNRIFNLGAAGSLTLNNLTLTGGGGAGATDNGGAISTSGTLAATNCTFSGNSTAGVGGAVMVFTGNLTFTGCTFRGNTTTNPSGGAFWVLNLEQKPVAGKWTSTFRFLGEIPAEATSVQLRLTSTILGQATLPVTEVFRFKDAYIYTRDGDLDGDGIGGSLESFVHGTDFGEAASRFGLASVTSTVGTTTLHVDTGTGSDRTYQLLTSPDLLIWTRDGLPTLVPGIPNGPSTPLQLARPTTPQRNFYKVQVQQPQVDIP